MAEDDRATFLRGPQCLGGARLPDVAFFRAGHVVRNGRTSRSAHAGSREEAAYRAHQQSRTPWGFAGFILNLITGFLLYAGDPVQYFHNVAFRWKMLFVVLAGLNLCAF